MPSTPFDRTLTLKDGGVLGYAEYGDPRGRPGFFFHGFPGSRLEARLGAEAATRLGLRIIAMDRPGFGLSDFRPGRRILDWPAVVEEVADSLGFDRFPVMGLSGGAPYAAVCAARIPHRLTSAAIVSGVAPFGVPGATDGMARLQRLVFTLAGRAAPAASVAMWWMGRQVRNDPEKLLDTTSSEVPRSDREIISRPAVHETLRDDLVEAFRQGSRGAAWELSLLARHWGFRLRDIAAEVHLWQGEADVNVPVAMGRYLARAIPNCQARFYPDEGHLLAVPRMEEIQSALFPPQPRKSWWRSLLRR